MGRELGRRKWKQEKVGNKKEGLQSNEERGRPSSPEASDTQERTRDIPLSGGIRAGGCRTPWLGSAGLSAVAQCSCLGARDDVGRTQTEWASCKTWGSGFHVYCAYMGQVVVAVTTTQAQLSFPSPASMPTLEVRRSPAVGVWMFLWWYLWASPHPCVYECVVSWTCSSLGVPVCEVCLYVCNIRVPLVLSIYFFGGFCASWLGHMHPHMPACVSCRNRSVCLVCECKHMSVSL